MNLAVKLFLPYQKSTTVTYVMIIDFPSFFTDLIKNVINNQVTKR